MTYEGDIVEPLDMPSKKWKFKIVWSQKYTAFIGVYIANPDHDIILGVYRELQIIGNIYENPELMKEHI